MAADTVSGLSRRSVLRNTGVGLGVTGLAVAASGSEAIAQSGRLNPSDILELHRLKAVYAIASDAIGAGDFDRGQRLYRSIFARDAVLIAGFSEDQPLLEAEGVEAIANAARGALAGAAGSQHFIGTTLVEPGDSSRTATITAYFHATVLSGTDKSITTYLGTYFDQARRTRGRWRLTRVFGRYLSVEPGTRSAP